MRLALAFAMAPAAALAGAPEGAMPEQHAAFASAHARLSPASLPDAELAALDCILDEVARAAGPVAVDSLIALTEAAAEGETSRRDATLRFVGQHGDAYYGIVAECRAPRPTDN